MWYKDNQLIVSRDQIPTDVVGFIYKIEFNNKFYIGKKLLTNNTKVKLGKKELAGMEVKRGRKATKKTITKESNWVDYLGSSKELAQDIKSHPEQEIVKIIIEYCYSKRELTYRECWWLFRYDVLEVDNCYNKNIAGRYFK